MAGEATRKTDDLFKQLLAAVDFDTQAKGSAKKAKLTLDSIQFKQRALAEDAKTEMLRKEADKKEQAQAKGGDALTDSGLTKTQPVSGTPNDSGGQLGPTGGSIAQGGATKTGPGGTLTSTGGGGGGGGGGFTAPDTISDVRTTTDRGAERLTPLISAPTSRSRTTVNTRQNALTPAQAIQANQNQRRLQKEETAAVISSAQDLVKSGLTPSGAMEAAIALYSGDEKDLDKSLSTHFKDADKRNEKALDLHNKKAVAEINKFDAQAFKARQEGLLAQKKSGVIAGNSALVLDRRDFAQLLGLSGVDRYAVDPANLQENNRIRDDVVRARRGILNAKGKFEPKGLLDFHDANAYTMTQNDEIMVISPHILGGSSRIMSGVGKVIRGTSPAITSTPARELVWARAVIEYAQTPNPNLTQNQVSTAVSIVNSAGLWNLRGSGANAEHVATDDNGVNSLTRLRVDTAAKKWALTFQAGGSTARPSR